MNTIPMHPKFRLNAGLAVGAFFLFSAICLRLEAQGTAFTYQGRLTEANTNFTGNAEFQPVLWNSVAGGTQVAANSAGNVIVGVTNGMFVLPLDFGANFPGANRWLELGVRTGIGAFTILSPRQELTPTPYAVTAANVSGNVAASQLSGTLAANLLPASVVTNNAVGLNLAGTFTGNGANVTNVNAMSLNGLAATNFWQLGGNLGADPAAGVFLGTRDNLPLEFWVNTNCALRLEYGYDPVFHEIAPIVIGGYGGNVVSDGCYGAFIGGGGEADYPNRVGGDFASVVGGSGNTATGFGSVAMGQLTTASGDHAVAMGFGTTARNANSTAMGNSTTAGGSAATAMGYGTIAGGGASVAMGYGTTANGFASLSAGFNATDVFNGTNCNNAFVWGDGSRLSVAQGQNTFNVLATGGVWFFTGPYPDGVTLAANATAWSTISDQNVKKNFQSVNSEEVLAKLVAVPVEKWNYQWEKDTDVPNIGPMAQAFKQAFYPGRDDKSITTLEFDGVELAAIQGLNEKLEFKSQKLEAENTALKQQNELLEKRLERLEQLLDRK